MNSPEYIQNAIRTESVPTSVEIHPMGLVVGMKLAILSSKLMDLMKRKVFYGKAMDPKEVQAICHFIEEGAALLGGMAGQGLDINSRASEQELIENNATEFNLDNLNVRLLHAGMGCFTESGELLEALEKQMVTGQLDKVNFGEEIGDIEWYQAIGFDESGVTEASCREKNIAKLKARYPEKFNADQAVNRDLAAERQVLEGE